MKIVKLNKTKIFFKIFKLFQKLLKSYNLTNYLNYHFILY
jgi:hypothetical protein